MMQRNVHLTAQDLLGALQFKEGDFGEIALVSGQAQRAERCLQYLNNPIKNFTFLGYTFWTGEYQGRRITVGNGGFYAPDSAFITELLCAGGIKTLIRLGSCGALREDIQVGDFIVADKVIRGDGATRYYVDERYEAIATPPLTEKIFSFCRQRRKTHLGRVWTTDALLRETKDIVNSYIKQGAIAVDMVSSPFVTIANLYGKQVGALLVVSDNLITGQLGFNDLHFLDAQEEMVASAFAFVAEYV